MIDKATKDLFVSIGSLTPELKEKLGYPQHVYVPVFKYGENGLLIPVRDTTARSTGTFAILTPDMERLVIKPPEAREDKWGFVSI